MVPCERAWSIAPKPHESRSYVLIEGPARAVYDRICNVLFANFDRKPDITPQRFVLGA
jgi:hypothetical protein